MQESLVNMRRGFARLVGRCVAAAFAVLSAGCVMEEPGGAPTASEAITAAELLGRQATGPGTFNNRCVDNVETAFAALPERPTGTMRYRSQGGVQLPPSNVSPRRAPS